MKSAEIRAQFLKFFESKGHQIVASSSLVPHGDPTLLFTNAGMNQFKDVFLGLDTRPYRRATTSQKCVRAGGKHNDLENVGYTARHHTFFEMLGNFSFGDYFKRDAIQYAWTFLTTVLQLPTDKLWVTVYAEDHEAYDIWHHEIGVPAERIVRIGDNKGARYASDNFWTMGDTGPCGPCTEIFYDHGPDIWGGPPGSAEEDGDRYIEIWNNVFMQFNRDEAGTMHPLPRPSVDTGMGLERISAVMQHVHSNYEIDLFQALIAAAARETHSQDLSSASLKVLADHIRACSFLIVDGVIPGNEGRGYVLRRIIRRAIRHGYKLGARAAFFHRMVPDLVTQMGEAYPELAAARTRVSEILKQEEDRFFETIENGMGILETALQSLPAGQGLDGELAFKLHDTYGFPLDLTADVCREASVAVDTAGFDVAMARQKAQARAAGKFKGANNLDYTGTATAFHGYDTLSHAGTVLALYRDGVAVQQLNEGESGTVVLDNTPFYAESGGQVGDQGTLLGANGVFEVEDTQKIQATVFGHHGTLKTGSIALGEGIQARVDVETRAATMRNHSVTHIMHKALREVLGAHVQQKGSLVDAEKTRFDFVHPAPVTASQIAEIERRVNREILANTPTRARTMSIDAARETGAMMLFGEKYGDEVRVLDIGTSCELCGGTHVARTGDIGAFKIVSESGVASGIRRIEATTGNNVLALLATLWNERIEAAGQLGVNPNELSARLDTLRDEMRHKDKEIERLRSKVASVQGDELLKQAIEIDGHKILAAQLDNADAKTLRETADKLRDKLQSCALVLGTVAAGKVNLIAAVTPDLVNRVKAGELVNAVAQQVGGKGGGKPDLAMAGGSDPAALPAALASVRDWVAQRLA